MTQSCVSFCCYLYVLVLDGAVPTARLNDENIGSRSCSSLQSINCWIIVHYKLFFLFQFKCHVAQREEIFRSSNKTHYITSNKFHVQVQHHDKFRCMYISLCLETEILLCSLGIVQLVISVFFSRTPINLLLLLGQAHGGHHRYLCNKSDIRDGFRMFLA